MHQTLLKITIPKGEKLYADQFRMIVAAQDKLSPALFGRGEDGNTVADPEVRFVGGHQWVGLVADGAHEQVVYESLGTVLDATARHFGKACAVEIERHELSFRPTDYPIFYRATGVALKRRGQQAWEQDPAELLTARIGSTLVKQVDHRGLDHPGVEALEVANVDFDRQLGMQLKVQTGPTKEYVSLFPRVTFSVFAELKGFWFVGNLSARGHGRILGQARLVDA